MGSNIGNLLDVQGQNQYTKTVKVLEELHLNFGLMMRHSKLVDELKNITDNDVEGKYKNLILAYRRRKE